jgi:hypothetical protein
MSLTKKNISGFFYLLFSEIYFFGQKLIGLHIKDKMTSSRQRVFWIINFKSNEIKN